MRNNSDFFEGLGIIAAFIGVFKSIDLSKDKDD